MDETPIGSKLLEAPGDVVDRIVALLSRFGIDLPPLVLQVFLLAVLVAFAFPVVKSLRARKKANRKPLYYAAALVLAAIGVVVGVVDNGTTPPLVTGQIRYDKLETMRASLLDYRGQVVSVDSGVVDTTTGRFALHYSPLVNGRARKLRLSADGCKPAENDLFRSQLRAGTELLMSFACVAA